MSTHNYTKQVNLDILKQEIENSTITIALDTINLAGTDALSISFKAALSGAEETTLNSIVTSHSYLPYTPQDPMLVEMSNTEVDDEGRQVNRIAAASKGWTYLCHPIEFETSKIASLYEKDSSGSNRNISSIKFYDINDAEITDAQYEINIVKTIVLFKPSYDYELVAGNLQQIDAPSTDVRLWVVGGIVELGGAYVKEFAGGINMRYFGANEALQTDGRASKYMKKDIVGVPYQANQLQIIVKHNAGVQHKLMLTLEYFRV